MRRIIALTSLTLLAACSDSPTASVKPSLSFTTREGPASRWNLPEAPNGTHFVCKMEWYGNEPSVVVHFLASSLNDALERVHIRWPKADSYSCHAE